MRVKSVLFVGFSSPWCVILAAVDIVLRPLSSLFRIILARVALVHRLASSLSLVAIVGFVGLVLGPLSSPQENEIIGNSSDLTNIQPRARKPTF